MLSKIRKISLKNSKVHVNTNDDSLDKPLGLTEIVPSDKDDSRNMDRQQQLNKSVIDSHITEQLKMAPSPQQIPSTKRSSTFSRFSTQMQSFFATMRKQEDSEDSEDSTASEEVVCQVPVNPMQTLLGTVSNNAYVSWTHISKVIKAMEIVNDDLDMNTSEMNKIMIRQCLQLLKDSPYILKSKKDTALQHKSAKFYKKSETDEEGNMIVAQPTSISRSRRASITALNQLRQKVVEFNAIPYGTASNDVSNYISNMVNLHMDSAFNIYSENNGTITNNGIQPANTAKPENEAKTEHFEINCDDESESSGEFENDKNLSVNIAKSHDHHSNKKNQKHRRKSNGNVSFVVDVSISHEISDKISQCLSNIHSWNDFNVFELFDTAGHMSMPILCIHILKEYNLISKLQFNESKLLNYLQCIQQVYNSEVPYHNAYHGGDVLATSYQIVKSRKKDIFEKHVCLQNHELFSLFVASMVHDVGHNGFNNDFHIKTQSDLALLYNDNSVLENYHVATSWKLLSLTENNFFDNSSSSGENRRNIRKLITDIVLHTDMAQHNTVVNSLKSVVETHEITSDERGNMICNSNEFTDKERSIILSGIVHTADISNPAKKFDFMLEWTNRLYNEFWKQGDKEREMGFKVSPLCDRENPIVEKSAIGFGKFVVFPLLQKMKPLFGVMDEAIVEFDKNIEYWSEQLNALTME